jgi:predicted SnoaL-like aldol condensation-catalyzing enzyme
MTEDYIQHNPNADTGMAGFKAYFSALGGEQPIPDKLDGLVAIQADGDYVTLSFSREYVDRQSRMPRTPRRGSICSES